MEALEQECYQLRQNIKMESADKVRAALVASLRMAVSGAQPTLHFFPSSRPWLWRSRRRTSSSRRRTTR